MTTPTFVIVGRQSQTSKKKAANNNEKGFS
jgi:hypothetical protein